MPLATAAAEPLDEPPGVCPLFHGLVVAPGWRQANSVVTVFKNQALQDPVFFEQSLRPHLG